jgi:Ca2+-binding RTX toxin-like protein
VTGGAGNDVFRLDGMGVTLVELAGGGVDRIESSGSYDLAGDAEVENLTLLGTARSGFGNGKANVITGNLGDNVLSGLGGRDTVNGMSGDDRILGGDGDDVLSGGGDDDRLNGGFGKDKLQGGIGDDTLMGGAGSDELTGGADTDTFVFRRVADSGTTTASRDVILGFVSGEDIIDLAAIDANANTVGNQAFTWIGTAFFTGVTGQLRFNTATADLAADVNGDGVADFAVRLTGVTALQSGDIVL